MTNIAANSSGQQNLFNITQQDVSMASIIWKRFRKHPGAIVGIFVFALLILSAILVPLSPYDPPKDDMPGRLA